MTLDWFNKLGDWNPQVFREVKGHLNRRNLIITLSTSFALQLVVLLGFAIALPGEHTSYNIYCTGTASGSLEQCIKQLGVVQVNWQRWWADLFQVMSWGMTFIVLVAGVYLLISDLAKEERRGTFNFIRLSPQTSEQILLGKLLGVPIVPYLTVAAAIPLHIAAAVWGQIPLMVVLSIYLFAIAVDAFFYTGSLLFAFLGGTQGWIGALVATGAFFSFFQIYQSWYWMAKNEIFWYWFGFPFSSQVRYGLGFALVTLSVGTYWIWQAVNRRFRNPNTTLLSKGQSYCMTASFELWMLGFAFQTTSVADRPLEMLLVLVVFNLPWFLLLTVALTPQRQEILDWARYRHQQGCQQDRQSRSFRKSLLQDLIWGEKSPALLAIGLNFLLTIGLYSLWMLNWHMGKSELIPGGYEPLVEDTLPGLLLRAVASLLLNAVFLLICAAIVQLGMLLKSAKRSVWITVIVGGLILLPPFVLGVLAISPSSMALPWLFTAFAFVAVSDAALLTIGLGLLGQVVVLAGLTARLTRQLQKVGETESKALLAGTKV
jgi:hypothetical protein